MKKRKYKVKRKHVVHFKLHRSGLIELIAKRRPLWRKVIGFVREEIYYFKRNERNGQYKTFPMNERVEDKHMIELLDSLIADGI